MNSLSKRSKDNLKGIHPDLLMVIAYALAISKVDFFVNEGVRTLERQKELYAQGRTKSGIVVTGCDGIVNKSNHQVKQDGYGHAVDIYPTTWTSKTSNSDISWEKLYEAFKIASKKLNVPIKIGGYWNMKDMPHIELGDRNW